LTDITNAKQVFSKRKSIVHKIEFLKTNTGTKVIKAGIDVD